MAAVLSVFPVFAVASVALMSTVAARRAVLVMAEQGYGSDEARVRSPGDDRRVSREAKYKFRSSCQRGFVSSPSTATASFLVPNSRGNR